MTVTDTDAVIGPETIAELQIQETGKVTETETMAETMTNTVTETMTNTVTETMTNTVTETMTMRETVAETGESNFHRDSNCLLYTSDAADE